MPRNFGNPVFVVHQLGRDQVDGSGGDVLTAVMNAGEARHRLGPVVHHESDIIRNSKLELTAKPIRNVGIEGNNDIGPMFADPSAKLRATGRRTVGEKERRNSLASRHVLEKV